jgi:hypothetical protein
LNKQTLIAGAIGLAVVAAIIGSGLLATRKNRLELTGQILKVRSYQISDDNTVAAIDFRVTNPSTQEFQVKEVGVHLETADGKILDAGNFTEMEAASLFDYYKVLGVKYNPTLVIKEKIEPNETKDRMIAVKFDAPDAVIQKRKGIRIVITDVDGVQTEIGDKIKK